MSKQEDRYTRSRDLLFLASLNLQFIGGALLITLVVKQLWLMSLVCLLALLTLHLLMRVIVLIEKMKSRRADADEEQREARELDSAGDVPR